MKKSDLKTGMLVQTKDYQWWFVFRNIENEAKRDIICYMDNDIREFMPLTDYNEDLTCFYEDYDIIKVANCNSCVRFFEKVSTNEYVENLSGFEIIWEREKTLQINIRAEIENIEEIKDIISDLEESLRDLKVKMIL